jgi:hypothetical protein
MPASERPPQYSPDGEWWWNGSEWIPASEIWKARPAPPVPVARPASRRPALPPRRWMAMAAALLVLLVAGSGGTLLALHGRPQAEPTAVAGGGDGTVAALTRALRARGHQCGPSPLVPSPQIWMCLRDRSPLEEYVVAQADPGGSRVGVVVMKIDQLDFGKTAKPTRQQTVEFFKAAVGAGFPAPTAGKIQAWVDRVAGTQSAADQIDGNQLSQFSFSGGSVLEVDVGTDRRAYTVFTDAALPNVTLDAARGYLQGRGLACRPEQGFVYCELNQPALYADAGIQLNDTAPTVWMLDLLIHAGPTGHDAGRQITQWFPDLERLTFRADNARRVASWIASHLERRAHRMVIGGIQVTLIPFRDADWPATGIWGMRLQIEVAKWP